MGCSRNMLKTSKVTISTTGVENTQDLSTSQVRVFKHEKKGEDEVYMPCCQMEKKDRINHMLGNINTPDDVTAIIKTNNSSTSCNYLMQFLNDPYEMTTRMTIVKRLGVLAKSMHELFPQSIRRLRKGMSGQIILTREQAACLLANAFFCMFDREKIEFGGINFDGLYSGDQKDRKMEKLKCLFDYFGKYFFSKPIGKICFRRVSINDTPNWADSDINLTKLHAIPKGRIEVDGHGMLQVDFANKLIGGGVLRTGLVQEEIRFITCPEMIVARLFTQQLDDHEALIMQGCIQYASYDSYGDNFRHKPSGGFCDEGAEVVAIDALNFKGRRDTQYTEKSINRELNKAYAGFLCSTDTRPNAVATGNWGCGVFEGDKQLKAVIQIMAASQCGRDVCFISWDDHDHSFSSELVQIHEYLAAYTIGTNYKNLMKYCKGPRTQPLFEHFLPDSSSINRVALQRICEVQHKDVKDIVEEWDEDQTERLAEIEKMSVEKLEEEIENLKSKESSAFNQI